LASTRIQLCGRFVVRIDGERIEDRMPGRQGRLLFAYLAAKPDRVASRDELAEALWPTQVPSAPEMALSALLSKLRRLLGEDRLEGRSEIRLLLPGDALIDVETARNAIHLAESQLATGAWRSGHWSDVYVPINTARYISERLFLRAEEGPWVEQMRGELDDICVRALECGARLGLEVGGSQGPIAERWARMLVERAPYRETGYCLLMRTLERDGNLAEAMRVYDDLRGRLREELGTTPSADVQEIHGRLLARS
jgi:DNA-binding SARP family transcriptional activator